MSPRAGTGHPRQLLLVAAALAGGWATSLAFAPTSWAPFVVLGPAVGLWAASAAASTWRGAGCGFAYGVAFSFSAFRWMVALDPVPAVVLPLIQGAFWTVTGAVAAAGARRLRPGWWVAATASTWLLAEAARARMPITGFEWGQLSMAASALPVRQAVAIVGALGLTGLLAAAAAALVVLARRPERRRAVPVAVVIAAVVAVAALGGVRWTTADGRLAVAVVQVDDPCPGAFAVDCPDYIERLVRSYVDDTRRIDTDVDLVVWGEDALPGAATRQAAGRQLRARAGELPAPVLGGVGTPTAPGRFLRWAALFGRDGSALDGYAKRMPVPFGEYVPLRDVLGGFSDVGRLVPTDLEAGDDTSPVVLHTSDTTARLGTVISWEVIFARAVRAVASQANGLATLTTVASYGTSAASDQLVAAAQLRAAEHQKPMVLAATTGRSALIDATGRVAAISALFQADRLVGTISLRAGSTPYGRAGDGPMIALAVAALWGAFVHARRVRTTSNATDPATSHRTDEPTPAHVTR